MAERLRDENGDIWESDGQGGWVDDRFGSYVSSREMLDLVWGPLSEVGGDGENL